MDTGKHFALTPPQSVSSPFNLMNHSDRTPGQRPQFNFQFSSKPQELRHPPPERIKAGSEGDALA